MMLLCPARVTHTCAACGGSLPPGARYFRTPLALLPRSARPRGSRSRGWYVLCGPCAGAVGLPPTDRELRDLAAALRTWYADPAGAPGTTASALQDVARVEHRLEQTAGRLREHAAAHPARGTEAGASQVHREIRDGKARLLRWADRLDELAGEVGALRHQATESAATARGQRQEVERLRQFLQLATGGEGRLATAEADRAEEQLLAAMWYRGSCEHHYLVAVTSARRLVRAVAAELEAEYAELERSHPVRAGLPSFEEPPTNQTLNP